MTNKKYLLIFLLSSLTMFMAGCGGGGGGGSATIPSVTSVAYSGTSQVKTYSSGAQQSFEPISSAIAWASDRITKTTTYTYGDGATNAVTSIVAPAVGTPTYAAGVQTIVTTYGDGTAATATNNSTSAPVTWASDHITKTTTYTFANGGTNPVVTTVAGVVGTPTYAAGVQTIVTTYGDGTTATATNNSISAPVTWASDHVTKTTTYTFANGATNPVVTTVAGVAGTPTYAAGVQTIVTSYGDGTTATATNNSVSAPVTWASDHVTKTTTYTFANGGTNPVVTTVAGVAGTPTYAAGVQTIVTTYGDGTTATATNNSISAPVTWAADHVTKTTTYTFANGGTNPVVTTVAGVAETPTYAAGVQTIVTTYGDGTTATATNNSVSAPVTWASDHVTKTTTYTFANGGTNPVVTTVAGVAGTPTYAAGVQTIVTTYGDGTTATATNNSISAPVTWASDHVTKTTTYTFANGGTNPVVTTVAGVAGTPTYAAGVQTIVTTYGDGTTATATNNSTSAPVTWANDHVTKTTTYTFANGGTNPVATTVAGTVSGAISSNLNGVVSVSPLVTTYGDGFVLTAEDGTSTKPFTQTTLMTKSITDPNSYTQSSTRTYDLTWGVKATPFTLRTNDDVSAQLSSSIQLIDFVSIYYGAYSRATLNQGFSFTGSLAKTTSGFQQVWITPEVKAAWADGWTGKGVKVGILDDFTANDTSEFQNIPLTTGCKYINVLGISTYTCSTSSNAYLTMTHGDQVSMIAGGAKSQITGYVTETGAWTDGVDIGTYSSAQDLIINFSSPYYGVATDATVHRSDFLTYQSDTNGLFSVLKNWGAGTDASSLLYQSLKVVNLSLGGTSTNRVANQASYAAQLAYANASVVPDAVFVKAAGNSSCTINLSNCDPSNPVFHNSPQYKDKSIIVGALNQSGGSIASYSNKAGTYADIFLVADGRGIYKSSSATYEEGTSFAAPRVTGYVAILRQKFPNLDAIKSSSVMLDTARYDTLTCYPNCDPAIYGRGEASLSRALAPVGYLR
jgi:hypothetical protein